MPLAGYLIVANLLTFGLFAFRRAGSGDGEWGGNETRTLFFAVMGGWPGAQIGRFLFPPERESRGFGLFLNVSLLFLPIVMCLPYIVHAAPGWVERTFALQPSQIAISDPTPGTAALEADLATLPQAGDRDRLRGPTPEQVTTPITSPSTGQPPVNMALLTPANATPPPSRAAPAPAPAAMSTASKSQRPPSAAPATSTPPMPRPSPTLTAQAPKPTSALPNLSQSNISSAASGVQHPRIRLKRLKRRLLRH